MHIYWYKKNHVMPVACRFVFQLFPPAASSGPGVQSLPREKLGLPQRRTPVPWLVENDRGHQGPRNDLKFTSDSSMDWLKGKITGTQEPPMIFMVKSMVSSRFSLKPIH